MMLFHGEDIPGTKLVNAKDFTGVPHRELRTYHMQLRSSGRKVPGLIYPGIVNALSEFRPDVILCEGGSNFFNNLLIYAWAIWNGVATIWWSLGEIPGRKFRGLSRIYRSIIRSMMLRSTVLLGYSSLAKTYFRYMGCRQPVFVSVNCVDTYHTFERIEAARSHPVNIRKSLGIDAGKKIILFVGALTAAKRIEDLVNAYAKVRTQRQDVALVIVGDGPVRQDLEQLAGMLNLQDVHFTGKVIDGVTHYFLAADLFVLPNLGGLAISEAMCHGLPLICTVGDGCERDLIHHERNGLILPPCEIETMAETINQLLDQPEKLQAMGQASKDIIRNQYNTHTYMDNLIAAVRCAYDRKNKH